MRVTFRADASPVIGTGHAMRCLTLADAVAARGAQPAFAAAEITDAIEARIGRRGWPLHRLDPVPPADGPGWERSPLSAELQQRDADLARYAHPGGLPDWIVVDNYRLDAAWEEAAAVGGVRLMAIDDLANRAHACELLLDQTLGRDPADYRPLVPAGCRVLAGPTFALLRPEFTALRPAALERRRYGGAARRILIAMGGGDAGGITARVTAAVAAGAADCRVDVVVGAAAPSLDALAAAAAAEPRIRIHIDSDELAALTAAADLAVGAPGGMSWERCCLALPAIQIPLADNQRMIADQLDAVGAAVTVTEAGLVEALRGLLADPDRRAQMAAAAAAVVDGRGAERLVRTMLGEEGAGGQGPIRLRAAIPDDSEVLWLWRNDPRTRRASQNQAVVPWAAHSRWFASSLASPDRHLFIAERAGEAVGMVRFDAVAPGEPRFEVSINLAPAARGGGTGRAVLDAGCRYFAREARPETLEAVINDGNPASRRIFEALGFEPAGGLGESGFRRYVLARPIAPAEEPGV